MAHYVCDLYGSTNWELLPEEVAARTFETASEAQQWFVNKYSGKSIQFSGFHQTERYSTSWVSCDGEEIGEITERPSSN